MTIVFGKPMNYRIFTEAELETAKFDEIEEKPVKEEVEDMTDNKSYPELIMKSADGWLA